ncbi:vacuolar membrane protein-domain-containing protein [Dichotomocladium elegans]|nr:vacuolar membrane protein-domain-containing protein [Dichotomocladium elegans]
MQLLPLPMLHSRRSIFLFTDPHAFIPSETAMPAADSGIASTTDTHCLGESDEGCKLLDSFAIVVQVSLATTALLVLVYKRYRERPQRPVPIWALDVSKQFVGAGVIHFLNLAVSYLVGRPMNGPRTNLCVWYFLNVLVDTTLGVGILWFWLHAIQYVLENYLHARYIRSGNYGPGPLRRRAWPWLKQTTVFVACEGLMKFCVLLLFRFFPVLFDLGNWALRWTRGNYRYQVVFVMFIFPLIMNAIQFWIVDTIVKVNPTLLYNNTTNKHANHDDDRPASLSPDTSSVVVPVHEDEQTPLLQASH